MGNIICIAQFVSSVILMVLLIILAAIPSKVLMEIAAILLALMLLTLTCLRLGRSRRALNIAICFISIFVTLSLSLFSVYAWESELFIRDIGTAEPVVQNSGAEVAMEPFNIYLCGSDSRESVDEDALNDLNMIVTVNPNTNQILLTSIPRDYFLELPSFGAKDKLTHAGIFGVEESMKTVENFTGLKMDFYVKVGFSALVYVVDAMGGINVESDRAFTAWTNPDVHIEKGWNHMDGVTALAYARERYAYEDGDIHRAQNQAQVLREVAWRAMSPGILIHYDKLLDALAKGMRTNMSDAQIRALIKMQLEKKAQWDICDYQMTGTGKMTKKCYSMWGRKLYVMIPDEESVKTALGYIEEFMNGEYTGESDQEGN